MGSIVIYPYYGGNIQEFISFRGVDVNVTHKKCQFLFLQKKSVDIRGGQGHFGHDLGVKVGSQSSW